jgi:nicotinamide mononucleotide adenylyltransferase
MGLQGVFVSFRYEIASAHGRFQPLHNGHMEYLLAAKATCRFLCVGITQYVRSDLVEVKGGGQHRASFAGNPLTYYERQVIITEALTEAGIQREDFIVTPFPIENPEVLTEFLPRDVPVLTTICEPWNIVKVERLRQAGYAVEILWERETKSVSGQRVRDLIANRDPEYLSLVPAATAKMVEQLQLWKRLNSGYR